MAVRRRAEALGFDIPRLEPDDAFVERLASAASASRPTADARRPLHGLRVGLATAGVVGLTVGGAWAAGNLVEREDQAPGPPPATESHDPIEPEPSAAPSTSPPGEPSARPRGHRPGRPGDRAHRDRPGRGPGGHAHPSGRPDRPGERGQGKGKHVGRPDEHPGKGKGPGDQGNPGQGKQQRAERADSGGPQGNGGGRRSDRPR